MLGAEGKTVSAAERTGATEAKILPTEEIDVIATVGMDTRTVLKEISGIRKVQRDTRDIREVKEDIKSIRVVREDIRATWAVITHAK